MNPSFTDTFEVPIAIEFEGKTYTLEKLKGRDFSDWCAELQQKYLDRNLPLIEKMEVSAEKKLEYESAAHGKEFSPRACINKLDTNAGVERVINKAFVRALTNKRWVVSDDSPATKEALAVADRFIESLEFDQQQAIAMRLVGVEKAFFDQWFGNKLPKPNPGNVAGSQSEAQSNLAGKSAE